LPCPTVNHVNEVPYTQRMPLYEFRCRTCDSTFDERRPMAEANAPATCPQGHDNAVRMLSVFASVGGGSAQAMPAAPSGGGCCGGGCCS
jgi:putative FmdB family regulatory protein